MAVAVPTAPRALQSTDDIVLTVKKHVQQAREARKPFEKIWLSNEAFAAGQHWLVWSDIAGQLVERRAVDPSYKRRQTYTANRVREYLNAQMGELSSGDDRPDLLTAQDGDEAEQVAAQLNDGARYAWENEWNADTALRRARGYTLVQGTSAIRCRFDKTAGPVAGRLAFTPDGQPVTHPDELASLEQQGALTDGSLPRFVPVNEGRTRWGPLTSFHILAQPGVVHEDDFSWFVIQEPVPIDTLIDEYGPAAQTLTEDGDIASAAGLTTSQQVTNQPGIRGRLRDHVWLFTHYELPCRRYPNGRVTVTASNSHVLLDVREQLDYQLPDGSWHTGVVFLHWNRLNDRFYSQAFIEPLKDPQRSINEIKSAQLEILWRGLPKVFVKEGDLPEDPEGLPLEIVELKPDAAQPAFFAGVGPGSYMDQMVAQCDNDLSHASTLSPLKLGENPANVDTYSQLALLNENENYKRSSIMLDHDLQKATLVKCGIYDMKRYYPPEKQIMVSGEEEGSFKSAAFLKARIPTWFTVKVGQGTATPRSQAAELKKIDAIWAAAVATAVIAGPNAQRWAEWYAASVNAGEALDLPGEDIDSQTVLAHYENTLLMNGEQPAPADHDVMPIHTPIHREALDHARANGNMAAVQAIRQHLAQSLQVTVTARKTLRAADPADTADVATDLAFDEDQALRENTMLMQGIPLNPEEMQNAAAALGQGINPETGRPLTPADNVQLILERASLKPTLAENLEVHMDRHGKLIKSAEFEQFPPDARRRTLSHFDQTRTLWLSIPALPEKIDAPHVTLALRESVGPSTIASVLRRAGVPDIDETALAIEPPLENMVQADVNEPDPQQPPASGGK